MYRLISCALLVMGLSLPALGSTTIDFENLPAGTSISNQYPEATFSTISGLIVKSYYQSVQGGGTTLAISPARASDGHYDSFRDIYVDFTIAVNGLSFQGIAVDGTGTVAQVHVYESGTQTATVNVVGTGNPYALVTVDLSAYSNVTRIEIVNITDDHGALWDNFSFTAGTPASWVNYGTGWAGTLGIPTFTATGNPVLGSAMSLDLQNSLGAETTGVLFVGTSSASTATVFGGTLLVSPFAYVSLTIPSFGMFLASPVPADGSLAGVPVYLQVLETDAGATQGLSFTPGLQLNLGS